MGSFYGGLTVCSINSIVFGYELHFYYFLGGIYAIVISLVTAAMGILLLFIWIKRRKLPGNAWGPKDDKLCIAIGIIGILFVVSTTPLTCVLLFNEYIGENILSKRGILLLFSLRNSLINPFIYLFRIKEFRESLKHMLYCRRLNTVTTVPNVVNVAPLRNSTDARKLQNQESRKQRVVKFQLPAHNTI